MTLRIVADENMPNVDAWFSEVASSIIRKPGRTLCAKDLSDADVLLVRSITQVNQALLDNTPVRFVGSATIGTDHIDQAYLSSQHIPFHYAPGCNAQSVADWLLAVLSRLHRDHGLDWWQKTIGIVGVGNVGSRVRQSLERFGCQLLVCDPLKAESGDLPEHLELDVLLSQADIICFHAPHTTDGDYPTHHMMSRERLSLVRPNAWIVNAGRGPIFEQDSLLQAIETRNLNVVLDVWPQEPIVNEQLLDCVAIASPHVAGYSLEGKFKGTQMLAESLCQWASIETPAAPSLPQGMTIDASLYQQNEIQQWASDIVLAVYDPARDTVTMRASVQNAIVQGETFDAMRKDYPTRRELSSVTVQNVPPDLAQWLERFGCRCD